MSDSRLGDRRPRVPALSSHRWLRGQSVSTLRDRDREHSCPFGVPVCVRAYRTHNTFWVAHPSSVNNVKRHRSHARIRRHAPRFFDPAITNALSAGRENRVSGSFRSGGAPGSPYRVSRRSTASIRSVCTSGANARSPSSRVSPVSRVAHLQSDPPLAQRYNEGGYDQTRSQRIDDFNDPGTPENPRLTPQSRPDNSSKNSEGHTYDAAPTDNYYKD